MGRVAKNRSKNIRKLKNKKFKVNKLSNISNEDLLKSAQDNIEMFNYEEAQKYCQEALRRDADNLRALEVSASLCIEFGNINGAKHCLGRAITLAPDSGFTKFFSMGQLMEGKESLHCYIKGIELLKSCIIESQRENLKNEKHSETTKSSSSRPTSFSNDIGLSIDPLKRKLSNAYCSIAEIFMSDLCDEDEAEKESESNVKIAIESDPMNPEAYQHYANFLLIKDKSEEARENIKKSVSLWLPQYQKVDDGLADAGTFDPIEICPLSDSTRFSCARILIELEEHSLATDVLESLMGENDEDVYTWYLMGWNFYLEGDDHKPTSKQHLIRALEIHEKDPSDDLEVIEHMNKLLAEMKDVPLPAADDNEDDLEAIAEIDEMDLS